eukprot:2565172-Prymnesium_polylepis.1
MPYLGQRSISPQSGQPHVTSVHSSPQATHGTAFQQIYDTQKAWTNRTARQRHTRTPMHDADLAARLLDQAIGHTITERECAQ